MKRTLDAEKTQQSTRFRNLFDALPDPAVIANSKGKILAANRRVQEITGLKKEQLFGKDFFRTRIVTPAVEPTEIELRTKDGKKILAEINATKIQYDAQSAELIIFRDVTKFGLARNELKSLQDQFRILFEYTSNAYYLTDLRGTFIRVNRAAERIFGCKRDELLGQSFLRILPDRRQILKARSLLSRNAMRHHAGPEEFSLHRRDGSRVTFEIRTYPVKMNGETLVLAIAHDISERRRMQEALLTAERLSAQRKNDERYRLIAENTSDLISATTFSSNPTFTYVSPSYKALGYNPRDLLNEPALEFVHPDDRKRLRSLLRRYVKKRSTKLPLEKHPEPSERIEFRFRDKSGNWVHLENTMDVIKNELLFAARDITQHKRMEREVAQHSESLSSVIEHQAEEVKDSARKFQALFQLIPDPVAILDLKGRFLAVNDKLEEKTGYKRKELIGKSFLRTKIATPRSSALLAKNLARRSMGMPVRTPYQIEVVSKNGEKRCAEVYATDIEHEGKRAVMGFFREVTERIEMEDALQISEKKYRQLAENAAEGIWAVDADGRTTFVNSRMAELLGYTVDEMLGKSFPSLLHAAVYDNKALRNKQGAERKELETIRKDGKHIFLSFLTSPIIDDYGNYAGASALVTDITKERKIMEMRDQFMSSATHELRTPLVSIKGYLDLVLSEVLGSLPKEVKSNLEVVKRNAERLLTLTDDLLDVRRIESGKLQLNMETVELREVLEHCSKEVEPSIDEKKQSFHFEVPEGPLMIQGDRIRLSQVVTNLLNNAVKFTPEGGTVTLRAVEEEKEVRVQVSDTGIGIRREDLSRVFEPFAAIKKPSYIKGTGLGLSVSQGLVRAHGGRIWAKSLGEGKGSTFTFTIPKRIRQSLPFQPWEP